MKKLYAEDLKKLFGVYGYFYNLRIGDEVIGCRSVLDIVAHDSTPFNPTDLLSLKIDSACLMMNPGGSRPIDKSYKPKEISSSSNIYDECELVPAVADATQYQIMRVMAKMGWNHMRIFNLSDIRQAKSPLFMTKVEDLATIKDGGVHSMFHESRSSERLKLMGKAGAAPMILGWGRDERLLPLVYQALPKLKKWDTYGVKANDEGTLYGHPSPMLESKKIEWLASIIKQIKSK